ncbi:hypothetical protein A2867_02680 [Candidatus Daviesbacteria bacterium RIFCSPHIGHO2_01_FULL_40_11]|uniref:Uncharacterized protein n=1 Tax=Candidatus Daviesbacteria bacterium RIFCSPHIGHO2_01_FULL_40_11 TaxID=1797762 RepID=A0A1F5JH37_9BACT|nr:MAG: hypothetical protein A2867_02680 [Candidatus Daviesbacteria bacterium RIFCSPHIGHO2_01_FULL_40_11]OGE62867.1 MAG: hypothetical protein A2964_00775 [Candidatus Daviesbacteria bacterium RIFCSPLOWO2_01_FULL_40_27]
MFELEPPPGDREYLFGPTDKLLIVKGRDITQEQGWTRCHRVIDDKENEIFWLKGLGLKTAEHQLEDTNIYRMYFPPTTELPVTQFDTVVKESLNCKSLWGPYKATLDPLLINNMYFAETFCHPAIEKTDPERPTS